MSINPWAGLCKSTRHKVRAPHRPYVRPESYAYLSLARDLGPRGMRAADMAARMDNPRMESVNAAMLHMHKRGLLQRIAHGLYCATPRALTLIADYEARKGISTGQCEGVTA